MKDIHECTKRLEAARRRLSSLKHGDLLLKFLDHLQALGLSTSRVLKYATCLCTIFHGWLKGLRGKLLISLWRITTVTFFITIVKCRDLT
ncbi:MAG: hypothetical protein QXT10_05040 [Candidatus Bathyarchaeia archaeon]